MNRLIPKDDFDTLAIFVGEGDTFENKIAGVKANHDGGRDVVIYNAEKGIRLSFKNGAWFEKEHMDKPLEAAPIDPPKTEPVAAPATLAKPNEPIKPITSDKPANPNDSKNTP